MKKFLAALLALVMVLSLAACGGGSDSTGGSGDSSTPPPASSDAGDSGSSSEKIDISVIASQYGQNTGDWWAKFQEDFNKEHEDINLTVEVVSWNDIYTVVNTRLSGDKAPEV